MFIKSKRVSSKSGLNFITNESPCDEFSFFVLNRIRRSSRFKSFSYKNEYVKVFLKNEESFSSVTSGIKTTAEMISSSSSDKKLFIATRFSFLCKKPSRFAISFCLLYGVLISPRYIFIISKKWFSSRNKKLSRQSMTLFACSLSLGLFSIMSASVYSIDIRTIEKFVIN